MTSHPLLRGALSLFGARLTCPSKEWPETDWGKGHTPPFRTFVCSLQYASSPFRADCVAPIAPMEPGLNADTA
jgi:hypothetical protein